MNKLLITLLFLVGCNSQSFSQIFPSEGSALNYRIVGFEPFSGKYPDAYTIQIASDNITDAGLFSKNIIKSVKCRSIQPVVELPSFGSSYTWRTITTFRNKSVYSDLHHFSTAFSYRADTGKIRLTVTSGAQKYKDGYVFIDETATLYDMTGKPVWFLPESFGTGRGAIRDLKLTQQGTITFLAGCNAYEVNYDGEVLWKAPDNGLVGGNGRESYHHEFTRLSNGHYMALGNESCEVPRYNADGSIQHDINGKAMTMPVFFGTVIEYDVNGNVVWSWKSSKYSKESDLVNYFSDPLSILDLHENAFSFDEKEKVVYVSFKNIDRIVKIKYPEGTVLNSYGETYSKGGRSGNKGLFCGQHACKASSIGCLFLFNNNGCSPKSAPKVRQFREMKDKNHSLRELWAFECPVDRNSQTEYATGGNVIELPDNALLVCMGGEDSKVFIVGMDKKILWTAQPQQFNTVKNSWTAMSGYRASMVTDHMQLQKLIRSTQSHVPYHYPLNNIASK